MLELNFLSGVRVKDFENYVIYTNGDIYSLYINNLITPSSSYGYLKVVLCHNGNHKTCTIHRLVAESFIPNPKNLKIVNHKDLNKINNDVTNLEWCSQLENVRHAVCNGKRGKGKFLYQFEKDGKLVASYSSIREASNITGIKISSISGAANGRLMYGGGFCWSLDGIFHKPIHKQCVPVQQICIYTGKILCIFAGGSTEAGKITGINSSQISAACKRSELTAGGYKWQYADPISDYRTMKKSEMEKECAQWVKLAEYPQYRISKDGRIYSERIKNVIDLKYACGYYRLPLKNKNGEMKNISIHRLVAMAYIPNPDNLPIVNHIDGDKLNNKIENLEWATYKTNAKHAKELGLVGTGGRKGVRHIKNSPFAIKVGKYTLEDSLIRVYDSISQAAKDTGTPEAHIIKVCQGKQKFTQGYKWKYLSEPAKKRRQKKEFPKARRVGKFSLNDEFIKSYDTLTTASKEAQCSKSGIMKVCQNKQKTAAGFRWKYLD